MPEPIPVVVASDANFFAGLHLTVASAIVQETGHLLAIHLLDGGIADSQWDALVATARRLNSRTQLTRHSLDPRCFAEFSVGGGLTQMTFARLLAPRVVPGPFAIYLDSDLLIGKPLSQLLGSLDSGKALGAVPEAGHNLSRDCLWGEGIDLSSYRYVNGGMLALNLEKWRKERLSEQVLAFLEKESARCEFFDQTAINWVLRDDIAYLPQAWNAPAGDYEEGMIKGRPGEVILHYVTAAKPWSRRTPALSHQLWWLFHDLFDIRPRPSNPLGHPRNLLRYARWQAQYLRDGLHDAQGPGGLLPDWKAHWLELRRRMTD